MPLNLLASLGLGRGALADVVAGFEPSDGALVTDIERVGLVLLLTLGRNREAELSALPISESDR